MIVARRVYLYVIALASLGMLVAGVATLIEIVLESLAERALGATVLTGHEVWIRRVSFATATGIFGLAAWAIHWGLAVRAANGPDGVAERRSGIRKLYLYGALLIGGLWIMYAIADLISDAIQLTFRTGLSSEFSNGTVLSPLATTLSLGLFLAYHARVAARDRALVPEAGAGATLRRWCVYGLAFNGLLLLLFHASRLLYEVIDAAASALMLGSPVGPGWGHIIVDYIGYTLAGLIVWLIAWTWSLRWYADDAGPDRECDSTLRKVYLYLVLLVAVSWTVWSLGRVLYVLLYWLLVPVAERRLWSVGRDDLIQTAASLIVFGLAWAYHARVLGQEALGADEPRRQATIRWIYGYLVAFVGSAALATGLAGTISTVVDSFVESISPGTGDWFAAQISLFVTLLAVGLPVWYIPWSRLQREVTAATARRSLARRVYLFVIVGLSVMTLLSSGAFTLYALLRRLLGDVPAFSQTGDLIEIASAAAVAVLFLVYNLRTFQRDAALARQDPEAAQTPAVDGASASNAGSDVLAAEANGHAVVADPGLESAAAVTLLIVRPASGADLGELLRRLEGAVSPGGSVQVATLSEGEARALLDHPDP
jgi:hypothetical protein